MLTFYFLTEAVWGDIWVGINDGFFLVLTRDGDAPVPAGVPEPASVFLWTFGGLSLAGASWRRNRNKKKLPVA